MTSACTNSSMNWEKYIFHCAKWNFEPIAYSDHTAGFLALGKARIFINYLMFSPSRQHVK